MLSFQLPVYEELMYFRELLEQIKDFEEQEFAGSKREDKTMPMSRLEPLNESGGSVLLNMVCFQLFMQKLCETIMGFLKSINLLSVRNFALISRVLILEFKSIGSFCRKFSVFKMKMPD